MPQGLDLTRFVIFALTSLSIPSLIYFSHGLTPYMMIAAFNYFLFCAGLALKNSTKIHARTMTLAITLDLLLVLWLQWDRNAIATAMEFSLNPLQQSHIFTSIVATALYFPTLFLGWGLYLGVLPRQKYRSVHLGVAVTAFVFRTLGFFLMFSMIPRYL